MKLINGDILKINLDAFTKNNSRCAEIDWDKLIRLCELDPADLALGAVGVLGVLKKRLRETLAEAIRAGIGENLIPPIGVRSLLTQIQADEAGLDLGKMKEIREKAAAFDLFCKVRGDEVGNKILAQAQAELAKAQDEPEDTPEGE